MTEKRDHVLAKANEIVKQVAKDGTSQLSAADVATLVAVTVKDIVQVCHEDEARLAKVETQTHALAEAVLVITEPDTAVAPAVQAVRAGMKELTLGQ